MEELRNKARALLESGTVNVVIGYGEGSNQHKVRPVFVQNPAGADRLIADERCLQNLAVYLAKPEIKKLGKTALVAPLPVLRTILQLAAEHQLTQDALVVLTVTPEGTLLELPTFTAIEEFVAKADKSIPQQEKEALTKIEAMSLEERWQFWQEELSRCIKCYACRAACPLCYCSRCTVECNQPQWISVPAHDRGDLEWHIMRAMHLAGRCVNCGECARACPLDIPLNLLTLKLADEIQQDFGVLAGTSATAEFALSSFKLSDKENFIK
jgi:ferredoxin